MEYNLPVLRNMYNDDLDEEENNEKKLMMTMAATQTFCGDLDVVETGRECKGMDFEYHLVHNLPPMETQYKKAQEGMMASRKEILTYIINKTRESYNRMSLLLKSDTSLPSHDSSPTDSCSSVEECTKKMHKLMHKLKT
jgi:hypothetical protein